MSEVPLSMQRSYLDNRRGDALTFLKALDAQDMPAIRWLAHRIKGTAGGYGFADLGERAADIEMAAKREDADALRYHLRDFHVRVTELSKGLAREVE